MVTNKQLPFDLNNNSTYERDNFFISSSNKEAISWIDKWPDWGSPSILIIIGATASGKTHLAKIWQQEKNAIEININNIEAQNLELLDIDKPNIVIDDINKISGDSNKEQALFHIYNIVKENQGSLLLTTNNPIKDCGFNLADLNSRLRAATTSTILPPDEEMMAIMLTKIFSDKQLLISQDVIKYIIPRIERSFKAISDLSEKIDYKSLTEKKSVTIPFVKSILED